MADNLLISRMLQDIIAATNRTMVEEEAELRFSGLMSEFFGIEKVRINSMLSGEAGQNELYGYVINTKKPYVDNQLSEYSSFPELIAYKNRSFRSCALVPIVVSGKVVSIVEMLSSTENKFSSELINSASFGAYLTAITLLYKSETDRSLRLAGYFSGAFNGPDPQLLVSREGKIVKANDSALKEIVVPGTQGKGIGELLGIEPSKLLEASKDPARTVQLERSGMVRYYKVLINQINDNLMSLSMKDVTELSRLNLLLDSMDAESYVGYLFMDNSYIVRNSSESIKRVIGYDRNLILGKSIIELTIEKQRGAVQEMLKGAKERTHGYIDLTTAAGLPTSLRFVMSKWQNGYIMLFSDTTSETYVTSIRSAFTDFISGSSDVVITMDELGYVKDCNIPAEDVLGFPKQELIGRDLRTLYTDQQVFEKNIAYVRNGGKVDNSYITLSGRNGTIDATQSIRMFKGPESVDYLIVIKELETKRKLSDLEDELGKERNRTNRLKSTGDLKSQFIYNISHELKTPLTNIMGFSKLLYKGEFGELNKDQLDYLSTIIEEADRLMLIIQQVLDAAKLESDKMRLEYREVDLKALFENPSMQALRETAANKGIELTWDVGFDVPHIAADPNRLIQVFVNLIGNSIKFTNKGSIRVKITRDGKSKVRCDVIDTGIGISEEDKHKLFKKFYEAPKKGLVKQEGAGTGLGLSIAQEIARLHGGKIVLTSSELGKGSTFTLTLRIRPRHKKDL